MALIDTTNSVDSSIYLKNKFPHNKVGTNYYIQNLQHKRDKDWEYRPNLADIEEELDKQCEYTQEPPVYSPIDVSIRTVKNEKGADIGGDWAEIAFRDLNHYNEIGSRYRFDTSFPDMSLMSEEQKHFNTSIWICVNKNPVSPGNNCIIRRCNSSVVFAGSPEGSIEHVTETHIEPVILENDLKYINMYYTQTVILPQAEWYATFQMNYFTDCIGINDRLIFGGVNLEDRENNAVFKVKAVVKSTSLKTFSKIDSAEIENIPLVILALDKDTISGNDDFHTRLANQPPIYFTHTKPPVNEYYFELTTINEEYEEDIDSFTQRKHSWSMPDRKPKPRFPILPKPKHEWGIYDDTIFQGKTVFYKLFVKCNNKKVENLNIDVDVRFEVCIDGKQTLVEDVMDNEYYSVLYDKKTTTIIIENRKRCQDSPLLITCTCTIPKLGKTICQEYRIILGGWYT